MIKIDIKRSLTNSQSYRTVNETLKEISFEQRFERICNVDKRINADGDLSQLLTDIITHYRNRRCQDFNESFWNLS